MLDALQDHGNTIMQGVDDRGDEKDAKLCTETYPCTPNGSTGLSLRSGRVRQKARGTGKVPPAALPVSSQLPPSCLGAASEAFADALGDFVRTDPERALAGSAAAARGKVCSLSECWAHACRADCRLCCMQKRLHILCQAACPKGVREGPDCARMGLSVPCCVSVQCSHS